MCMIVMEYPIKSIQIFFDKKSSQCQYLVKSTDDYDEAFNESNGDNPFSLMQAEINQFIFELSLFLLILDSVDV